MTTLVFKKEITSDGTIRIKKRTTTIFLAPYPEFHFYFCPDCRMPMFKYRGEVIEEVPGGSPLENIIEVQCKNPACGRTVHIEFAQ